MAAAGDIRTLLNVYLENQRRGAGAGIQNEVEVRFGGGGARAQFTKIQYEKVVSKLWACGFSCDNIYGHHYLRISPDRSRRNFNVRAELNGLDIIKQYCRAEDLERFAMDPANREKVKFTEKSEVAGPDGAPLRNIVVADYQYSISYKVEKDVAYNSAAAGGSGVEAYVANMVKKWPTLDKVYRFINRVKFTHPDFPILVDISIVKSSAGTGGGNMIPRPNLAEAKVLAAAERYEIELEIDNERAAAYETESLLTAMRKCIRIVLSAIQGTNYPIGEAEKAAVVEAYGKLTGAAPAAPRFFGPSSVTLQQSHLVAAAGGAGPNIREGYTVTDKADGERKQVFVWAAVGAPHAAVYLIDNAMNVSFTGHKVAQKMSGTLLDGEFIATDKEGKPLSMWAGFDIYFYETNPTVALPLYPTAAADAPTRLEFLNRAVADLAAAAAAAADGGIKFRAKEFLYGGSGAGIFAAAKQILDNEKDGNFPYNIDGLIFTPAALAVGQDPTAPAAPPAKTWQWSLKWKPPKYNTIDFLVKVAKNAAGHDDVRTYIGANDIPVTYKILELYCGFSAADARNKYPWNVLVSGQTEVLPSDKYRAGRFIPADPYDAGAKSCFVALNGIDNVMLTAEGQVIEDETIVEFSFDENDSRATEWRWKPLRVRYDKTADYKAGRPQFGNSYRVANDNWFSIHYPVTEEMITTGQNIPPRGEQEDIYYNKKGTRDTATRPLRDFHNLFVKRRLFGRVMGPHRDKESIMDFAVGKGGDINKWHELGVGFVFGIDYAKDNIHNPVNGAAARYLARARGGGGPMAPVLFKAMFLVGDSAKNIRVTGEAFEDEAQKTIARAIFQSSSLMAHERERMEKGVLAVLSRGSEGFSVTSCQFALHYFCRNAITFNHFLRNVAECTKLGGYFVATCYDGELVFRYLRDLVRGEKRTLYKGEEKLWEISKEYDAADFPADHRGLGYTIQVFQESIGKTIPEFLVNMEFLQTSMLEYGFILAEKVSFKSLFDEMTAGGAAGYLGAAPAMTDEEKTVSFFNKSLIFQKTREVRAADICAKNIKFASGSAADSPVAAARTVEVRRINREKPFVIMAAAAAPEPEPPKKKIIRKKPAAAAAEPPAAPAAEEIAPDGKRCPKGTRRNKKTGLCEKVGEPAAAAAAPPAEPEKKILVKVRKEAAPPAPAEEEIVQPPAGKRCPKGTQRNKKTGLCEKKKEQAGGGAGEEKKGMFISE